MHPEPVDLLIEARWVLPIAPVNTVLADHAVAVSSGRIVELGPIAEMNARFEPRVRTVRPHHALLPGFVNAHTRTAMTLLRGLPVRGPRSRWMLDAVQPSEQRCMSPDYVRDGAHLAMAEMLRSGITSFADMHLFPEETARAAAAARMRAAIGLQVTDVPNAWAGSATEHLAKAERLWDEYKSDPWVSLYFAPQDANEISDETLGRVQRVADELDARVAMQLHETRTEVQTSLSIYGRTPLDRLEGLGLLRPGFTAIHMNHVDADDLQLVERTGISVAACVQSDLHLGSGVCPVRLFESRRIVVGLGTSDPVSCGALDVLAEARVAALLANAGSDAPDASEIGDVSSEAVLRMATLGGATALGFGNETGSIQSGKSADLVCWSLDGLSGAGEHPAHVPEAIVFGATRQQATDVWTGGRAVVSQGSLLAFDELELTSLARQWALRARVPARRRTDRRVES